MQNKTIHIPRLTFFLNISVSIGHWKNPTETESADRLFKLYFEILETRILKYIFTLIRFSIIPHCWPCLAATGASESCPC